VLDGMIGLKVHLSPFAKTNINIVISLSTKRAHSFVCIYTCSNIPLFLLLSPVELMEFEQHNRMFSLGSLNHSS
jgi:hypothetical protein